MELIKEKEKFYREVLSWDVNHLAMESKKKLEEYKKTGEGYLFAESYYLGQILFKKIGKESSFIEDLRNYKDPDTMFQISAPAMLQNYFFNGKRFQMTDAVYNLLKNTKNKHFLRNHPFPIFAIDHKIEVVEKLNILFTVFYEVFNELDEHMGCNYFSIGIDERDKSEFWIKGTIREEDLDKNETSPGWPNKGDLYELRSKIHQIYANFLDYLNHPYSQQKVYNLSANIRSRIKRGKFPKQDRFVIDIKPEFLSKMSMGSGIGKEMNSKFWVRGHFRHFRDENRYKKIYAMNENQLKKYSYFVNGTFISKWILPYIKGVGELKEKTRRAT